MNLRHEAMLMLEKRGAVMDTARAISRVLKDHHVRGAVICGVAVVLHGHIRTTKDVDVLIQQPLEPLRAVLESEGFEFDAARAEFTLAGVAVHLVPQEMLAAIPAEFIELEEITTVRLGDLISMKLHS